MFVADFGLDEGPNCAFLILLLATKLGQQMNRFGLSHHKFWKMPPKTAVLANSIAHVKVVTAGQCRYWIWEGRATISRPLFFLICSYCMQFYLERFSPHTWGGLPPCILICPPSRSSLHRSCSVKSDRRNNLQRAVGQSNHEGQWSASCFHRVIFSCLLQVQFTDISRETDKVLLRYDHN
jgi:hypothetical protein